MDDLSRRKMKQCKKSGKISKISSTPANPQRIAVWKMHGTMVQEIAIFSGFPRGSLNGENPGQTSAFTNQSLSLLIRHFKSSRKHISYLYFWNGFETTIFRRTCPWYPGARSELSNLITFFIHCSFTESRNARKMETAMAEEMEIFSTKRKSRCQKGRRRFKDRGNKERQRIAESRWS